MLAQFFLVVTTYYAACSGQVGHLSLYDIHPMPDGRLVAVNQLTGYYTTICSHNWDDNDATVLCRSLGMSSTGKAKTLPIDPVYLREIYSIHCTGSEQSINDCLVDTYDSSHGMCLSMDDAALDCTDQSSQAVSSYTTASSYNIQSSVPISITQDWPTQTPLQQSSSQLMTNLPGSVSQQVYDIHPMPDGRLVAVNLQTGNFTTICSYNWDDKDATVLCRSLGMSSTGKAKTLPMDPVYLREIYSIHCTGSEQSINDCLVDTYDSSHGMCLSMDDAALDCTDQSSQAVSSYTTASSYNVQSSVPISITQVWPTQTPLQQSSSQLMTNLPGSVSQQVYDIHPMPDGRLVAVNLHTGHFTTICSYNWDDKDATVLCRSLGMSSTGKAKTLPMDPVYLREIYSIHCTGSEQSINDCLVDTYDSSHGMCLSMDDAALDCTDQSSQAVSCYTTASSYNIQSSVPISITQDWPTQTPLQQSSSQLMTHLPGSVSQQVYDIHPMPDGRLVAVNLHTGHFTTICSYNWDDKDATVLCRSLGMSSTGKAKTLPMDPVYLREIYSIHCTGSEQSINDCLVDTYDSSHGMCLSMDDAALDCTDQSSQAVSSYTTASSYNIQSSVPISITQDWPTQTPLQQSSSQLMTHLPGSVSQQVYDIHPMPDGRLVAVNLHTGHFTTICSYNWDDKDATVLCRSLGMSSTGKAKTLPMDPVYLREIYSIHCTGSEQSINDCLVDTYDSSHGMCLSMDDAALDCTDQSSQAVSSYTTASSYNVQSSVPISITQDWPTQTPLQQSSSQLMTHLPGSVSQQVYDIHPMPDGRLVAVNLHTGHFTTICSYNWDDKDATVLCRSLGMSSTGKAKTLPMDPVYLREIYSIHCTGSEQSINDCLVDTYDSSHGMCLSMDDAALDCTDQSSQAVSSYTTASSYNVQSSVPISITQVWPTQTPLQQSSSQLMTNLPGSVSQQVYDIHPMPDGRLVAVNLQTGHFTTICSYNWDDKDATVLCRSLGMSSTGKAKTLPMDPVYLREIYSIHCTGSEQSINDCLVDTYDSSHGMCLSMDDAALDCTDQSSQAVSSYTTASSYNVQSSVPISITQVWPTQTPLQQSLSQLMTNLPGSVSQQVYDIHPMPDGRLVAVNLHTGHFTTICSYNWDDKDATVLCRSLGMSSTGKAKTLPMDPVYLREIYSIHCTGSEQSINDCLVDTYDSSHGMCLSMDDAALDCTDQSSQAVSSNTTASSYNVQSSVPISITQVWPTQTPLQQSSSQLMTNLPGSVSQQVYDIHPMPDGRLVAVNLHTGHFTTICSYNWDDKDATVLCRSLGMSSTGKAKTLPMDPVYLREIYSIHCTGSEQSINDCLVDTYDSSHGMCLSMNDAALDCTDQSSQAVSSYTTASSYNVQSSVPISITQVWPTQTPLQQSSSQLMTNLPGSVSQQVYDIHPMPDGRLVAVNLHTGHFTTICSYNWDDKDATVLCRSLGMSSTGKAKTLPMDPVYLREIYSIHCTGSEQSINDCLVDTYDSSHGMCLSMDDAALDCTDQSSQAVSSYTTASSYNVQSSVPISITLVWPTQAPLQQSSSQLMTNLPGSVSQQVYDIHPMPDGRLVAVNLHTGHYTTICSHNWDDKDATVLCRSLGMSSTGKAKTLPMDPVYLREIYSIHCTGSEQSINDCLVDTYDSSHGMCLSMDDAALDCTGQSSQAVSGYTTAMLSVNSNIYTSSSYIVQQNTHMSTSNIIQSSQYQHWYTSQYLSTSTGYIHLQSSISRAWSANIPQSSSYNIQSSVPISSTYNLPAHTPLQLSSSQITHNMQGYSSQVYSINSQSLSIQSSKQLLSNLYPQSSIGYPLSAASTNPSPQHLISSSAVYSVQQSVSQSWPANPTQSASGYLVTGTSPNPTNTQNLISSSGVYSVQPSISQNWPVNPTQSASGYIISGTSTNPTNTRVSQYSMSSSAVYSAQPSASQSWPANPTQSASGYLVTGTSTNPTNTQNLISSSGVDSVQPSISQNWPANPTQSASGYIITGTSTNPTNTRVSQYSMSSSAVYSAQPSASQSWPANPTQSASGYLVTGTSTNPTNTQNLISSSGVYSVQQSVSQNWPANPTQSLSGYLVSGSSTNPTNTQVSQYSISSSGVYNVQPSVSQNWPANPSQLSPIYIASSASIPTGHSSSGYFSASPVVQSTPYSYQISAQSSIFSGVNSMQSSVHVTSSPVQNFLQHTSSVSTNQIVGMTTQQITQQLSYTTQQINTQSGFATQSPPLLSTNSAAGINTQQVTTQQINVQLGSATASSSLPTVSTTNSAVIITTTQQINTQSSSLTANISPSLSSPNTQTTQSGSATANISPSLSSSNTQSSQSASLSGNLGSGGSSVWSDCSWTILAFSTILTITSMNISF